MARSKMPSVFVERAAAFLIARAKRPITLEAEVAHKHITRFVREYEQWLGEEVTWNKLLDAGVVFDCGSGKWGSEYRIYWPMSDSSKRQMERYGFRVEKGDVRHRKTNRINNKDLFEALVTMDGLTLGKNR